MALNANKTGKKIADIITDSGASPEMKTKIIEMWTDIMTAIYTDIKSDLEVTVPSGSVIIAVAGSATGTSNPMPIKNGVQ